ncbi:MAG: hypothetical protein KF726_20145 [Anaerolineae bacterium]|nr:hypothetical protein [Anaerolineae bacterium]
MAKMVNAYYGNACSLLDATVNHDDRSGDVPSPSADRCQIVADRIACADERNMILFQDSVLSDSGAEGDDSRRDHGSAFDDNYLTDQFHSAEFDLSKPIDFCGLGMEQRIGE